MVMACGVKIRLISAIRGRNYRVPLRDRNPKSIQICQILLFFDIELWSNLCYLWSECKSVVKN